MIGNKIVKSFYAVEVTGDAIEMIMDGDYGIKLIALSSKTIGSDVEAGSNLNFIMDVFKSVLDDPEESIDFNPEFFPDLKPLKLSEKQQIESDIINGTIDEMSGTQAGVIPITNMCYFDPDGDFIFQHFTLEDENSSVTGKAGIDPKEFVIAKQMRAVAPLAIRSSTPSGKVTLH